MNDFNFDELFSGLNLDSSNTNTTTTTITQTQPQIVAKPKTEEAKMNDTNKSSLLQSAQDKMQRIAAELNDSYVERDVLINLMQIAIATGTNLLMLGPPGTAKSQITHDLCSRIDQANYFQWMLNKTTDPSEILGSFSVKELENDKFLRITTGKLPEAHIGFLDEVYKSNAPTLNALLTIMNEHIFYNDGKAVDIPLISLIGASNEPPEDETLLALHDRFIFRINLEYVHDVANKKRMHSNYLDKRAGLLGLAGRSSITLNEIKALQEATNTVKVSKDIINKFIRLISTLERQAIHVSDRRQNECLKVMQGSAVLAGRNSVTLDDFKPLIYVLWEQESHIPIIETEITKIINPYDDKFKDIRINFESIKTNIDTTNDPNEKTKKAIESKMAIEKLVSKTNKLINDAAKNNRDVTEFTNFRNSMVQFMQELLNSTLGTTFSPSNKTNGTVTADNSTSIIGEDEDIIPF